MKKSIVLTTITSILDFFSAEQKTKLSSYQSFPHFLFFRFFPLQLVFVDPELLEERALPHLAEGQRVLACLFRLEEQRRDLLDLLRLLVGHLVPQRPGLRRLNDVQRVLQVLYSVLQVPLLLVHLAKLFSHEVQQPRAVVVVTQQLIDRICLPADLVGILCKSIVLVRINASLALQIFFLR